MLSQPPLPSHLVLSFVSVLMWCIWSELSVSYLRHHIRARDINNNLCPQGPAITSSVTTSYCGLYLIVHSWTLVLVRSHSVWLKQSFVSTFFFTLSLSSLLLSHLLPLVNISCDICLRISILSSVMSHAKTAELAVTCGVKFIMLTPFTCCSRNHLSPAKSTTQSASCTSLRVWFVYFSLLAAKNTKRLFIPVPKC